MQEYPIRSHRLEIPVPPYTSGPKLNGDPAIMWEAVTKERNFLGELNPGDRIVWFGMFPTGQYVPEPSAFGEDYAHFMLSPREAQYMGQPSTKGRESFLSPENLQEDEIEPAASFLLEFSRYPDTVFGYNIGFDPEAIKPSSQTWRNFHIQCLKLPPEISELAYTPKALREPGDRRIEGYLTSSLAEEIVTSEHLKDACVVSPDEVHRYGFRPNGCAVIDLGTDMNPQRLSGIIKDLHTAYASVHERWARTFFTNYDDVKESQWTETYDLKPKEDVMSALSDELTADDIAFFSSYYDQILPHLLTHRQEWLAVVQSVPHGNPVPPIPSGARVPFEGPTYSATYFSRDGRMFAVVMPHLLRRSGSVEALGIEVKRILVEDPVEVSYSARKENAQRYFDEIVYSDAVGPH